MKRLIAAGALLIAATGMASATDLFSLKDGPAGSSVAPNTWTGFYVGVNGGYGWDHALNFADALDLSPDVKADTKPAGAFGGVTAGVDWQAGGIVLGFVTDLDIANIADDSAVIVSEGEATDIHSTIDWFGTLRARIGLPVSNALMPYGTGGIAYGGVSNRAVFGPYDLSADKTLFGWTAGAGVEWRMSPGWSLSGEWLHVDLGNAGISCPECGTDVSGSVGNVFDVARVVLTYRIDQNTRHPQ
jgi:outer membrane immunogenic protein